MSSLGLLWAYRQAFLNGLLVTAELLALGCALGTTLGITLAWISRKRALRLRGVLDVVTLGVIAVPALVILFWLYYPAQTLLGISVPPFWTAVMALVLMNGATVYRVISDAMKALPRQYIASAQVCGLPSAAILRHITLPLLLRASLPRWVDQQVLVLQTSVFASLISVPEIFRVAQRVNASEYRPIASYTAMAILFAAAAGSGLLLAQRLRRRYERDFSER
jgi:His/Glu/Gln/Arg/opine family amino acid ABC transporter permease subunit